MSGQPLRLRDGGIGIDRATPLGFTFDGRERAGYAGDTLASALLAGGQRLVARSFKYHRPRGIFALGLEEPGALVTLGRGAHRDPNVRATTVALSAGLAVHSQNRWPCLGLDLMAVSGWLAPLFVAGFYYKTFMRPASWWEPVYERLIRRAAGLGAASRAPDPDRYAHAETSCEVLVVGGGPAGLEAARTAAAAGADVLLAEERPWLGGRLAVERETVDGRPAADWVARASAALDAGTRIRVLTGTSAFGLYDGHTMGLLEHAPAAAGGPRQRSWTVRARHIVLATGALEQALAFAGNDLPGVMLAGAARGYVQRFAVAPGRRTLVLAGDDDGARTALDLQRAGAGIAGVVDTRNTVPEATEVALAEAGVPLYAGHGISRVLGRHRVRGARIAPLAGGGSGGRDLRCDAVAVAGGWQPAVHLHCHLGGRPGHDAERGLFLPPALPAGHDSAGACAGVNGTDACRADGRRAGAAAAAACGHGVPAVEPAGRSRDWGPAARLRVLPARHGGKRFVDLQHDVTVEDVALALREGYRSVEHLKRYTTLGMGTDQGKTANLLGLDVLAGLAGVTLGEAGTTTFRPPWAPVTIGALAGRETGPRFRPRREAPAERWHRRAGAEMIGAGLWHRPRAYPAAGETREAAVRREAAHVRRAAGIVDVSTLGKIALIGPDAATVVDRLYANGMRSLRVGRLRYGIMLRDDGFLLDDGTVCRLGEQRYLLTTTTANAAAVLAHIERLLETAWCELRAAVASVSDHWAAYAIAGPRSRDVLAALFPGLALDDTALPFLAVAPADFDGAGCLVMRNSYSGERAYEVYVPADYGTALWQAALVAGRPHDLRPYGTEAMGTLRIEKGHVAGAEMDGRVTAEDLGLGRLLARRKGCVGQALRRRPALHDPRRPRLVGLLPRDAHAPLRPGALLRAEGATGPEAVAGHVTSVAFSPERGSVIALGLLAGGDARRGEAIEAWDPLAGRSIPVQVVAPVFVDPGGERLHA